jgi:hypothetical protein
MEARAGLSHHLWAMAQRTFKAVNDASWSALAGSRSSPPTITNVRYWAGNFACVFALGVAWFPTTSDELTTAPKWIGQVHYTSAALLFITLAIFCLFLLGKTDTPEAEGTDKKKGRDVVHIVCGVVIIACIVVSLIVAVLPDDAAFHRYDPIFWAEAVAISAFGVSWSIAGKAFGFLKDPWEYRTVQTRAPAAA